VGEPSPFHPRGKRPLLGPAGKLRAVRGGGKGLVRKNAPEEFVQEAQSAEGVTGSPVTPLAL